MISVIGAGPAGCYTAYLLAKNRQKVSVFEEHSEIGKPVQCTGLVTSSIKRIIKIDENLIKNKIKTARIFAPNSKFLEISFKNENLILDREKFDKHLAEKAIKAGAKIFLGCKFVSHNKNFIEVKYKNKNISKIKTDILVGADGPLSKVSELINKNTEKKFWHGIQVIAKYKNDNAIKFYPYIGKFAWVVPENESIARIGILAEKNTKNIFEDFLKLKGIKQNNIIETQAGIIPVFNKKLKTQQNNIYILGDAATQVKATTAGGIIQGLTAAECLADSIINNKNYEEEWRKKLEKDLVLHLIIRKILDNFNENDYNKLIDLFQKEENKKILENFDRDYIKQFLFKMLVKEPKLLLYSRKLFF